MSEATTVYRFFDADGVLLYVGISNRFTDRISQHARTAKWFAAVATTTLEHYETREEALRAEAEAIQNEGPIFNVVASRNRDAHLKAKANAHKSWAATDDRTARTQPARNGLHERFLREAGGDPVKADHIRKAFYADLAMKSVEARRLKKALRGVVS